MQWEIKLLFIIIYSYFLFCTFRRNDEEIQSINLLRRRNVFFFYCEIGPLLSSFLEPCG